MAQAILGALGSIAGGIQGQTRRERSPRLPLASSTSAIVSAEDRKLAKLALKNAREERLYDLLSQPEVLGFGMTFAGIAAAQMIPFSNDRLANESIQAIATSCAVLMGLGYAGVGDLTTTVVAGLAGAASLTQLAQDVASGVTEGTVSALLSPIENLAKFSNEIVSAPFKGLQTLFGG